MLQVGVDQDDRAAAFMRMVEASQHRCFLAEVARELQQDQRSAGMGLLPLTDDRDRGIARAVIDQNESIHIVELENLLNEATDDDLFVEASRYDPELLAAHASPAVMTEP